MTLKKNRKGVIAAFAAAAALSLAAFAGLNLFTAQAEETPLTMVPGASVRVEPDRNGIRFTAEIDQTFYEEKVQNGAYVEDGTFGMLLFPEEYLNGAAGTVDYKTYFEEKGFVPEEKTYTPAEIFEDENGAHMLRLSLVDLYLQNVTLDFTAVAYYSDGATCTYSAPAEARSAFEVAAKALAKTAEAEEDWKIEAMKEYLLLAMGAQMGAKQTDEGYTYNGVSYADKNGLLEAVAAESAYMRSASGDALELSEEQIAAVKAYAETIGANAVKVKTYGETAEGAAYTVSGTDVFGKPFSVQANCGGWTETTVLVEDLAELSAAGSAESQTVLCGFVSKYLSWEPAIAVNGEVPETVRWNEGETGSLTVPAATVAGPDDSGEISAAWSLALRGGETVQSGTESATVTLSNGIYELTYTVACGGETLEKTFVIDAYGADTATSGTLSWNEITISSAVSLEDGIAKIPFEQSVLTVGEWEGVSGVEYKNPNYSSPIFRVTSDREFKITQSSEVTFKVRGGEGFTATSGGIFITYQGAQTRGNVNAVNGKFVINGADGKPLAYAAADNTANGNNLGRDRAPYGTNQGGLLLNTTQESTGWTTITLTFEGVENPTLEGLVISFANATWYANAGDSIYISDFTIEEGAN